jgi:hypothetical protein
MPIEVIFGHLSMMEQFVLEQLCACCQESDVLILITLQSVVGIVVL